MKGAGRILCGIDELEQEKRTAEKYMKQDEGETVGPSKERKKKMMIQIFLSRGKGTEKFEPVRWGKRCKKVL